MLELFILFAPTGVIIGCALNAPGAMHESTVVERGMCTVNYKVYSIELVDVMWSILRFARVSTLS